MHIFHSLASVLGLLLAISGAVAGPIVVPVHTTPLHSGVKIVGPYVLHEISPNQWTATRSNLLSSSPSTKLSPATLPTQQPVSVEWIRNHPGSVYRVELPRGETISDPELLKLLDVK